MFSDPEKNIEQCGIQAGMDIADLGAGSGFYTISAAKALASTGCVYAVDAQKELLTKLKNTASREGLYNIEVVWGDIEKVGGTHLREGSIDFVMLCNVLFQIEDRKGTIQEIKRILKPNGRVLVVDWSDSFGGIGPRPENIIQRNVALEIFEAEGFHLDREIRAGAHHYGIILKKL